MLLNARLGKRALRHILAASAAAGKVGPEWARSHSGHSLDCKQGLARVGSATFWSRSCCKQCQAHSCSGCAAAQARSGDSGIRHIVAMVLLLQARTGKDGQERVPSLCRVHRQRQHEHCCQRRHNEHRHHNSKAVTSTLRIVRSHGVTAGFLRGMVTHRNFRVPLHQHI